MKPDDTRVMTSRPGATAAADAVDVVVFDLGGVLIDWNPRHLYRKLFGADEAAMEAFLQHVCNSAWNERQDRGRPWAEAVAEAVARHPAHEPHIRAYHERWEEMLGGALHDTVAILRELKAAGVRVLALTNWSAETFPIAERRFDFLQWFDGVVVSGREGLMKPEPEIFQRLIERHRLEPSRTVFIDDHARNVEAAIGAGLRALRFVDAQRLRTDLAALGLPVRAAAPGEPVTREL